MGLLPASPFHPLRDNCSATNFNLSCFLIRKATDIYRSSLDLSSVVTFSVRVLPIMPLRAKEHAKSCFHILETLCSPSVKLVGVVWLIDDVT